MLNPTNLFLSVIFGAIGVGAFVYGKKNQHISSLLIGLLLIIYPYFVPQVWLNLLIGVLLCAALYIVPRIF